VDRAVNQADLGSSLEFDIWNVSRQPTSACWWRCKSSNARARGCVDRLSARRHLHTPLPTSSSQANNNPLSICLLTLTCLGDQCKYSASRSTMRVKLKILLRDNTQRMSTSAPHLHRFLPLTELEILRISNVHAPLTIHPTYTLASVENRTRQCRPRPSTPAGISGPC
jgi:hypothetical protein